MQCDLFSYLQSSTFVFSNWQLIQFSIFKSGVGHQRLEIRLQKLVIEIGSLNQPLALKNPPVRGCKDDPRLYGYLVWQNTRSLCIALCAFDKGSVEILKSQKFLVRPCSRKREEI
jgi:hypothetical protein